MTSLFTSTPKCFHGQWSSDVVEKREFAGKMAKLAAAELAKLSRRVFGEQITSCPTLPSLGFCYIALIS